MNKIPNAFTINTLMGSPFPFSATFSEKNNIHRLSIYPIQIRSIRFIIKNYIFDYCVIFDIDYYQDETLSEIATEKGMKFQSFDDNIIICLKHEFEKLPVDYFPHYNWETFDCLIEPDSNLILENYIACKDYDWDSETFLLQNLKNSSFYLNSHDDCYLLLETYKKDLLLTIFQQNLMLFSYTVLFEKNINVKISEFPISWIEKILSKNQEITILQNNISVKNTKLCIPFSNTSFNFVEKKDYPISGYIFYGFAENQWSIEKSI